MIINFNQCEIEIDNTGIIASNANLSVKNTLNPTYSLGNTLSNNDTPGGPLQAQFNVTYLIETHNEPLLAQVNLLKTGYAQFNNQPFLVKFCGLSGAFLLESYALNITPMRPIEANASLVSYHDISGNITASNNIKYDTTDTESIAHGLTTAKINGINLYDLEYNFNVRWTPIYVLGQMVPLQTTMVSADERVSFLHDQFHNITYSGQSINDLISFQHDFNISGLQTYYNNAKTSFNLPLSITGKKVISESVEGQVNDIVRVRKEIIKYY